MKRSEASLPRVCLVTELYSPIVGGGETYTRLFAGLSASAGMPVFVLTRRIRCDLPSVERVDETMVYRLPPSGMLRLGKYVMLPVIAWELYRRRREYDVIYAANFRVMGLVAVIMGKLLHKKSVLRSGTCGELSGEYATTHKAQRRAVMAVLALPMAVRKKILGSADAYISNNSAITREFTSCGVPKSRVETIPNGVDTAVFSPASSEERRALRRKLGLPEAGFLVGYSGKLNKGKGLDMLMSIWPEVVSRAPEAHLVLIGAGGDQSISIEPYLREQAAGLTSVTFTGYVPNVPDYVRALDLFVLPTEYEAMSNSLLEAMSCGLPCIATSVGGLPDVIDHPMDGLLIPPHSPHVLTEAILAIHTNPEMAGRIARAARHTVEERFSIGAVADMHTALFARFGKEAVVV